jgi:putative membrane protein
MKFKISALVLIILCVLISFIDPIFPKYQYLQHAGTLVIILPLIHDLKQKNMGLVSFFCLVLFALLHILGAYYIYSFVPYQEWFSWILNSETGFWITERNHFDRFVHFCFGLLFFPYTLEVIKGFSNGKFLSSLFIAFLSIQTFSMIYELFEWSLTFLMANGAEDYNGQQGDSWDAHKDMALAMLGSLISACLCLIYFKKTKRYEKPISN